jgi:hypothetical protein
MRSARVVWRGLACRSSLVRFDLIRDLRI